MALFHFPLLFLLPDAPDEVEEGPFRLIPRRWEVSIFDLYSLAAERHPVRVPVELMHIFLQQTNLEIAVESEDHESAKQKLEILQGLIYTLDVAPTLVPFATSHSINSYAGINGRSSGMNRSNMHEGLREGITVRDSIIEGWPVDLSLMCLRGDRTLSNSLSAVQFQKAASAFSHWQSVEIQYPAARGIRRALAKAPLMPDMATSILHIWQALENVFQIDKELTFRVSLLLAELWADDQSRRQTYTDAKKSYSERSKIAHGSASTVTTEQWMRAWRLLQMVCKSVLKRGAIPKADDLTDSLLLR